MSEEYKREHVFGLDYGTSDFKFGPITLGEIPEVVENRGYFIDKSSLMSRIMGVKRDLVVGKDLPRFLESREDLAERMVYPMRNGVVAKDDDRAWRVIEELTRYALETFAPRDESFQGFYAVASISVISPRYMYERLFEVFRKINEDRILVKAATIIPQPLAVAIAQKTPTCTVVESGHGNSVPHDEPILILEGDNLRVVAIGELVDRYIELAPRGQGDLEYADLNGDIYVLTFNPLSLKVEFKPISRVYRHKSPKKLYLVKTKSGRKVIVTADHNIFILRDGCLELVKTLEVRKGDLIPTPKILPEISSSRGFIDILDYYGYPKWIYVKPDKHVRNLVKKFRKDELVKRILGKNISRITLYGDAIRADKFLKLAEHLGINLHRTFMIKGRGRSKYIPSKILIDEQFLKACGAFLAEGTKHSKRNNTLMMTLTRCEKLDREVKEFFQKFSKITELGRYGAYIVNNKLLSRLFFDMLGANAGEKRIPPEILSLPLPKLAQFLRAYFEGDGYAPCKGAGRINNVVGVITKSRALAHSLMIALLRFGIVSRVRERIRKSKNQARIYYEVYISGSENLKRFAELIGFCSNRKNVALASFIRVPNTNVDVIPCGKLLREARLGMGLSSAMSSKVTGMNQRLILMYEEGLRRPSRKRLEEFALLYSSCPQSPHLSWLMRLAESDIFWDEVVSVEEVDPPSEYVYDVSCPGNENFLAGFGGIFVHNTQICPISMYPVRNAVIALNRGGGAANALTMEILKDAGYGDLAKEESLVRLVKEKIGLIPRNLDEALRYAKSNLDKVRISVKVPGTRIKVDLGEMSWARFLIGEYVFNPGHEIFQSYFTRGMPKPSDVKIGDTYFYGMMDMAEAITTSIERCSIELQPHLYSKILLSGGNFGWGVPEGLEEVAVTSDQKLREMLAEKGVENVEVMIVGDPKYSVWRGCIVYGYAVPLDYSWRWERMEGWMNVT